MTHPSDLSGSDWERFREFVSLLARAQAGPRWQGKIDLSGVVQQTLLEAFQASPQLRGCTEAQKRAWLRQALTNNLNDEFRKLRTAKRDVGRERSLEAQMAESFSRLEQLLPATLSTPSRQAAREERLLGVAQALAELPANQRQVIELHHMRGQTLAEVADALGMTRPAVAGLLHRGLKRLRELLTEDEA
jgi:RNA polymerase sigma-70 factor (ECF subfamily)